MRKILFALAALTVFGGVAEARDGCGRGFFFDGRRCVPMRVAPPPPQAFVFAGPDRWGKPQYYPSRRGQCPRGFTVQSGLCKPYRGF